MVDKKIAVDGCELEDVTGHGTVRIESSPSNKMGLPSGNSIKGIYFGPVSVSVKGSNGGGSIGDGNGQGTGTITGTGNKTVDGSNQPALLEGDTATIQVSGTTTSGSTVTPVGPIPVTVRVKSAGQSKFFALK